MIGVREGNEIQDDEILTNTQVEQSPAGMMQLRYFKEDGSLLVESDWFEANKRSQAIIPWCAAVRQKMLDLFRESESERRQRVEELRKSRPKIEVVEAQRPDDNIPAPPPTDPIEFARHHYRAAYSRHNQLTRELEAIKPELAKWKTVLTALGVTVESEDIDVSPAPELGAGLLSGGLQPA